MKFLILSIVAVLPAIGFGQTERFYQSSKFMIHETTQKRISAVMSGNYALACNISKNASGFDTQAYYLSFELFKNSKMTSRLNQDLGPFYVRNLERVYAMNLPYKLHESCLQRSKSKVHEVVKSIDFELSME